MYQIHYPIHGSTRHGRRAPMPWVLMLVLVVGVASPVARAAGLGMALCDRPGRWIDPDSQQLIPGRSLYPQLADQQAVLLGESHDNAEHHRWQLQALAALYAHQSDLVLGFEMFPRAVQPVLDRWVAGELDEQAFLQAVDWQQVWGFDPDLYLPLLHFARMQQIPMVALNVERSLVSAVGQTGWAAVPLAQREGVGDPAPASDAYRRDLAAVFASSGHGADESIEASAAAGADPLTALADDPGFQRFVEAQLTWDRAMAEALAEARQRHGVSLAVGIMGQGHVLFGHGVPHQLRDLGLQRVVGLVPLTVSADCQALMPGMARAVFMVADYHPPIPQRPRLGVMIEDADSGVRITQVVDDSVATVAGLQAGDVILEAAGETLAGAADLIRVVQRQAPGTWLPLVVQRAGEALELVARFPPVSDP